MRIIGKATSKMKLTNIKITKLWGSKSYDIKIKDNILIVVGENGSGKSTILKLIYLFLSKQWDRINEIHFEKIEAIIDGKSYSLASNQMKRKLNENDAIIFYENHSEKFKDLILDLYDLLLDENYLNQDKINSEKGNHTVLSRLTFILNEFSIADMKNFPVNNKSISEPLFLDFIDKLEKLAFNETNYEFNIPILYLPTYRRTELNFTDFIFQFIDTEDDDWNSTLYALERAIKHKRDSIEQNFLELAEFGLGDVFYRLEKLLKDGVIYSKIEDFLSVCNKYLNNKKLFIEVKTIKINMNGGQIEYLSEDIFSSGEKQIISIFFYLILSGKKYFVIIDEPEISISMFWQEKFLLDILESNCSGLITATHSPFIFKNALRKNTYSFENFRKVEG